MSTAANGEKPVPLTVTLAVGGPAAGISATAGAAFAAAPCNCMVAAMARSEHVRNFIECCPLPFALTSRWPRSDRRASDHMLCPWPHKREAHRQNVIICRDLPTIVEGSVE